MHKRTEHRFYITFGGEILRRYFVVFRGANEEAARRYAKEQFGDRWAGIYIDSHGEQIVEKHGLAPLIEDVFEVPKS